VQTVKFLRTGIHRI